MKYLYSILIIIFVSTLITVYVLWPERLVIQNDVVLSINGHQFTQKLIDELAQNSSDQIDNQNQIPDSLITRELLIQEARKQAIDQEPGFRKTLKTFYEQSLIKLLMDRKVGSIDTQVTEKEIDTYLAGYGNYFTFSKFPVSDTFPKKILYDKGEQTTALFDDLAEPLKLTLSSMNVGELKEQFRTSNTRLAIRLDKIEPSGLPTKPLINRKIAENMLLEFKQEEIVNTWIGELRSKASIQIYNEKNNHEQKK